MLLLALFENKEKMEKSSYKEFFRIYLFMYKS